MRRLVALLVVVGVGGVGAASTSVSATAPVPVGDATAIAPGVELRPGVSGTFAALAAPTPVAVGDALRTDATGYAEVAYGDGSRTRLDVNTTFEVLELTDNAGAATTRTAMAVGRTWHRVESAGQAGEEFSVETSQATATVIGTAFMIACPTGDSCTYLVAEGSLRLTLADGTVIDLIAPSAVNVTNGVPGPVLAVPFDAVFGDPWLADNGSRDTVAGFADPATMFQSHGPAYGSLTGTFTGTRTITDVICVAECPDTPPVGDVAERTYNFAVDCSAGVPCSGTVETQFVRQSETVTEFVPMTFDGHTYTWGVTWNNAACFWDDNGDGAVDRETGSLTVTISWSLSPSIGEVRDESWHVTALDGGAHVVNEVTEPGGCTYMGDTQDGTISISR